MLTGAASIGGWCIRRWGFLDWRHPTDGRYGCPCLCPRLLFKLFLASSRFVNRLYSLDYRMKVRDVLSPRKTWERRAGCQVGMIRDHDPNDLNVAILGPMKDRTSTDTMNCNAIDEVES